MCTKMAEIKRTLIYHIFTQKKKLSTNNYQFKTLSVNF